MWQCNLDVAVVIDEVDRVGLALILDRVQDASLTAFTVKQQVDEPEALVLFWMLPAKHHSLACRNTSHV